MTLMFMQNQRANYAFCSADVCYLTNEEVNLRLLHVCDVTLQDLVNAQTYRRFRVICWFRNQSRLIQRDDEGSKFIRKVPTRLSKHKVTNAIIRRVITVKISHLKKLFSIHILIESN
jgi:hypothetical protein